MLTSIPSRRGCTFNIPRIRAFHIPVFRKTKNTFANQLEHSLMKITCITFEAFYGPAPTPATPIISNIITAIFEDSPYLSCLLELQSNLC
ncbi:5639_t:CDS:2 [Funneliformis caledonium]|uniref:5639_t:CDS:1 n=1 Tax=Funneliformis caledonium TaxID=1117310 RepID=A0A9N8VR52_9GLOM|nr:5639_t:CDS:2 [Funneliformis caledonium]